MRSTKKAKLYKEVVELEAIIEEFGNALRSAHMPYIVERGQFTWNQQSVWNKYVIHAMRVTGKI